ncbi:MAG: hypothetical protein GY832_38185 [Chloroflexi bacterium]|nr:hypothetical protein [Chloroflexota bacterium]
MTSRRGIFVLAASALVLFFTALACDLSPIAPTDTVSPTLTSAPTYTPVPTATEPLPTSTPTCAPLAACICPDFWPHYLPRSLGDIMDTESGYIKDTPDYIMSAEFYPSRVLVTLTGERRLITSDRKERIGWWLQAFNLEQPSVELFEEELLIVEDSGEYWLPVQSGVLGYLSAEVAEGEQVLLFVALAGAKLEANGEYDWLFLINEYCTVLLD